MSNNSEETMVSVLCTCYNHEPYIRDCLNSIIEQKTNFKFEVIVHDDASTDNSAKIIKDYENKYPNIIKPIYQVDNKFSKGISATTKIMLPKAKGKYIAFCECDDLWSDKSKLQLQFQALENNSDCSMCVHKVRFIRENGEEINNFLPTIGMLKRNNLHSSRIISQEDLCRLFWKPPSCPFHTTSYFIKKKVFENTLGFSRDIGYLHIAMHFGNIYYIDSFMSKYRLFSKGSIHDNQKKTGTTFHNGIDVKSTWEFMIDFDYKFDCYTNYKYHKYIIFSNFLCLQLINDKKKKNLYKTKYNIKLRDIIRLENFKDLDYWHYLLRFLVLNKIKFLK